MNIAEDNIVSAVSKEGIVRPRELTELLGRLAEAYLQEFSTTAGILLFGGITLGEFQPSFSDIDLAVVFDGDRTPDLNPNRADLPFPVRRAVASLPLAREVPVSAKHVCADTMRAMQRTCWHEWVAQTAGVVRRPDLYPFTLCDTYQIHRYGVVIGGSNVVGTFPFTDAPPTCPETELTRLQQFAERFSLPAPFGPLEGSELIAEVIYYATDLTRSIYTLTTGKVTGRVSSTQWYRDTWGGEAGEMAFRLGQMRCSCTSSPSLPGEPSVILEGLFAHYARETLAYALPYTICPVLFANEGSLSCLARDVLQAMGS